MRFHLNKYIFRNLNQHIDSKNKRAVNLFIFISRMNINKELSPLQQAIVERNQIYVCHEIFSFYKQL